MRLFIRSFLFAFFGGGIVPLIEGQIAQRINFLLEVCHSGAAVTELTGKTDFVSHEVEQTEHGTCGKRNQDQEVVRKRLAHELVAKQFDGQSYFLGKFRSILDKEYHRKEKENYQSQNLQVTHETLLSVT